MPGNPKGVPPKRYTAAERAAAVERYRTLGPTAAAAETGISKKSLSRWAADAGVTTQAADVMDAAHKVAAATMAQRKMRIADRLADEVEHILDQLHAPTVEKRLVQASGSLATKIVEIRRPGPTVAEKKTLMIALGIAVDKLQVLTGGVTERIGLQGDEEVQQEAARVLRLVRGTG